MYLPKETITVFSFHCSALSHFHFYFHSAASCLAGIASRDESIVSISLKNSAWRLVNGDHLETSSYFPSHYIENLWMDGWMYEWMNHLVSLLISPKKAFEFPTLRIMLLGTNCICKAIKSSSSRIQQWRLQSDDASPRELKLSRTTDRINNHHQRLRNSLRVRLRNF